jgi:hypothetical protein
MSPPRRRQAASAPGAKIVVEKLLLQAPLRVKRRWNVDRQSSNFPFFLKTASLVVTKPAASSPRNFAA